MRDQIIFTNSPKNFKFTYNGIEYNVSFLYFLFSSILCRIYLGDKKKRVGEVKDKTTTRSFKEFFFPQNKYEINLFERKVEIVKIKKKWRITIEELCLFFLVLENQDIKVVKNNEVLALIRYNFNRKLFKSEAIIECFTDDTFEKEIIIAGFLGVCADKFNDPISRDPFGQ